MKTLIPMFHRSALCLQSSKLGILIDDLDVLQPICCTVNKDILCYYNDLSPMSRSKVDWMINVLNFQIWRNGFKRVHPSPWFDSTKHFLKDTFIKIKYMLKELMSWA